MRRLAGRVGQGEEGTWPPFERRERERGTSTTIELGKAFSGAVTNFRFFSMDTVLASAAKNSSLAQ